MARTINGRTRVALGDGFLKMAVFLDPFETPALIPSLRPITLYLYAFERKLNEVSVVNAVVMAMGFWRFYRLNMA